MNFQTSITFILIVAGVFFTFGLLVSEQNAQYPDQQINSSQWEGKYDYVNNVTEQINPLKDKFDQIQDTNLGFFTRLAAGIVAIPYAIIIFPQVIFGGLTLGSGITVGLLAALAIPGYIVIIVIAIILTWALFRLVEFFQRSRT